MSKLGYEGLMTYELKGYKVLWTDVNIGFRHEQSFDDLTPALKRYKELLDDCNSCWVSLEKIETAIEFPWDGLDGE